MVLLAGWKIINLNFIITRPFFHLDALSSLDYAFSFFFFLNNPHAHTIIQFNSIKMQQHRMSFDGKFRDDILNPPNKKQKLSKNWIPGRKKFQKICENLIDLILYF